MKQFSVDLKEAVAADITDLLQTAIGEMDGERLVGIMADSPVTALFVGEKDLATCELATQLQGLFPARGAYKHYRTSPVHYAADLRAALTGKSLTLLYADGRLLLPGKQRVFAVNFEMSAPVTFYVTAR